MTSIEHTLSQLPAQPSLPTDILREEVAKWVPEKDRAAFAASCKAAHEGITQLRKAELLHDVFSRGHITPQPTAMFAERLPTVDEVMRRGAKSPMHVNFRGILSWANKHFPPATAAEADGSLRRFYQETAELFWPEVPWFPICATTPLDDNLQCMQHHHYARRYPIDPLPQLIQLKRQDPQAKRWEWLEAPEIANGAMRPVYLGSVACGYHRRSALAARNLPDMSELNPAVLRKYMTASMRFCVSVDSDSLLGNDFGYDESPNTKSVRLGFAKGYAFQIDARYLNREPSSITFSAGIHRYHFLLHGVKTKLENATMQVSLVENEKVRKTYPVISQDNAGVYRQFDANLSSMERLEAENLVRSGHCERIAGLQEWLCHKENHNYFIKPNASA